MSASGSARWVCSVWPPEFKAGLRATTSWAVLSATIRWVHQSAWAGFKAVWAVCSSVCCLLGLGSLSAGFCLGLGYHCLGSRLGCCLLTVCCCWASCLSGLGCLPLFVCHIFIIGLFVYMKSFCCLFSVCLFVLFVSFVYLKTICFQFA